MVTPFAAAPVCSLSPSKSDLSDFDQPNMPNSGKPEFGWGEGWGEGLGSLNSPVTPSSPVTPHPRPLPKWGEGAHRAWGEGAPRPSHKFVHCTLVAGSAPQHYFTRC